MVDNQHATATSTEPLIHDRGRGPEIKGTRITVFDILDYTTKDWDHTDIAKLFRISLEQVRAAVRYIEAHKPELMPQYQEMLDRDARGNSPEIQAKLDAIREKNRPMWEELRRKWEENRKGSSRSGLREPRHRTAVRVPLRL